MGLLTNSKDLELFQNWFKENCKLRGIAVKYRYPVIEDITIHGEIEPKFSDELDLNIVFDQNPNVKTLKRIGWIAENPEDKPYIAMLPIDTPYLQMHARILIPPVGQAIPGRWFEVTSISSILEYPDCYTCTLAPVFENNKKKTNYDVSNYNYIDAPRANQPLEDSPNNEPLRSDELSNFKFLRYRR